MRERKSRSRHTWKVSRQNTHLVRMAGRIGGRERESGEAKQDRWGECGGFLRLPATLYPFAPRHTRRLERARCDLTTLTPLSWHQLSPLTPGGLWRDAVHTRKKKKKCLAAVKCGSDTASRDTSLWLRMYYGRTLARYRRFHTTFDIAYGINEVECNVGMIKKFNFKICKDL